MCAQPKPSAVQRSEVTCRYGSRNPDSPIPMSIAITRAVPASIVRCELTHLQREPIDLGRARAEHARLESLLVELGLELRRLPQAPDMPDSVFVDDMAVVLDEIAVLTRSGAPSRHAELESVEELLRPLRPLSRIEAPGTMDGGDVLVLDREIVVGLTTRTNPSGVAQLRHYAAPYGYSVRTVPVRGCLHLQSAVTPVGRRSLLANPAWASPGDFPEWDVIETHASEPFGANAILVGEIVVYPEAHVRTRERLEAAGCRVRTVPAGELAKAEGGVTCCALMVR